jgi:hypothetical protein
VFTCQASVSFVHRRTVFKPPVANWFTTDLSKAVATPVLFLVKLFVVSIDIGHFLTQAPFFSIAVFWLCVEDVSFVALSDIHILCFYITCHVRRICFMHVAYPDDRFFFFLQNYSILLCLPLCVSRKKQM